MEEGAQSCACFWNSFAYPRNRIFLYAKTGEHVVAVKDADFDFELRRSDEQLADLEFFVTSRDCLV
jgi:hypothetical protein